MESNNNATRPMPPTDHPMPSPNEIWTQALDFTEKVNRRLKALEDGQNAQSHDIGKINTELLQINNRFKPIIFLPRELDQLNIARSQNWPSIARDDRPYDPGDSAYSPPRGFPIGWTPPPGIRITKNKGLVPPSVTADSRPDQSWKPPGWKEPGLTKSPDLKAATEKAKATGKAKKK